MRARLSATALTAAGLLLGLACPAFAAEFRVNSTLDAPAVRSDHHVCRTATGVCTLRAAIETANATPGDDTVVLPAGTFRLTRRPQQPIVTQAFVSGADPDNGCLKITGTVTVRGAGANRTTIDGGRIDRAFGIVFGAMVRISDVTITGGDANAPATQGDIALGGAILNFGNLTLERVALVHNHADGGGGLFTAPGGIFTIRDSLIAGNTAVEGGGVRADTGGLIVNTTITGNLLRFRAPAQLLPDEISGYGGGIDHRGGANLTIVNSTITDNHAYKAGGGINSGQDYAPVGALAPRWPSRVYLRNTIVAGNTAGETPGNCHVSAMIIQSLGHNLAGDRTCSLTGAGDLPGEDPRIGPLAANGGPTGTQALLPGSPAIAAGTDCPSTDQRGLPRPAGRCDIGAFEHQPQACSNPRGLTITLALRSHERIASIHATAGGQQVRARLVGGTRILVYLAQLQPGRHTIRLLVRAQLHHRTRLIRRTRTVEIC